MSADYAVDRCDPILQCNGSKGVVHTRDGQRSSNSRSHVEYRIMNGTIVIYFTALLNAFERSVHLHGPLQLPVVNNFLYNIKIIMCNIIVFPSTPQVVR